jgi:DNA-binding transcriptional MerR regulator
MDDTPSDFTIDELARRVELPSSTIRMYQHRGLLPAPRKQGRVAYYATAHVVRIELIGRLQERGFSLAAIGELVSGWESGRGLDEVLGLERTIPGVARPTELRITPAELAARFPGEEISPAVMRRVIELGLIDVDGDELVIASPTFLEVGTALVELGFPLSDVLEEAATLRTVTDGIAERFTALFERHVWRPFADDGMPPERLPAITATLERLGPLAERVVQSSLEDSLAASAARLLAREAGQPT